MMDYYSPTKLALPLFSPSVNQNPLKVASYQRPIVLTRHMLPHLDFEHMKETRTILCICVQHEFYFSPQNSVLINPLLLLSDHIILY